MLTVYLIFCFFFVLLQGFFNASEISFISSHLLKLHHRKDRGDKRAQKVYQLLHQPEKFLITTLIGTNISLVLSSSFLTFIFIHLGVHDNQILTTILFAPLIVIIAELIPKNIGRTLKEDLSCLVVEIIFFFRKVFFPIIYIIESLLNFIIKTFIGKENKRLLLITKEELRLLIKDLEATGNIDRGEKAAIEDVFNFKKLLISDVCIRIENVSKLKETDTLETIIALAKKEGFTRYPVFKDSDIIGYVNIYDVFYNPKNPWQNFIRPLPKIDAKEKLYTAFLTLKNNRENIALVMEKDNVFGIITISDLMREIISSMMS